LFGLPVADDMPGRPLLEAFDTTPPLSNLPSWESADDKRDPRAEDRWPVDAAIEQLVALGYADHMSAEAATYRDRAIRQQHINLAYVHLNNGHPEKAIALLEPLLDESVNDAVIQVALAEAHFKAGDFDRSEGLAFLLIGQGEDRPLVRLLHAHTAISRGDTARALEYLAALERSDAVDARLSMLTGQTFLRLRHFEAAERHYRRSIEIDGRLAAAWRGLASALLAQKKYQPAAEAALEAVGFNYDHGAGHYLLGVGLACIGRIDRAVSAFETCIRVEPGAVLAHRWLDRIHTLATGDHERAQYHRARAAELTAARPASEPASSRA
jgi:tetratricopeptide (TPR) repeat protein